MFPNNTYNEFAEAEDQMINTQKWWNLWIVLNNYL
jgi:hypothetical protein